MARSTGPTALVEAQVIERDGGCCARCGRHVVDLERGFAWSIHHRCPRSAGGTRRAWVNFTGNLVVLCGSGTTGCHGWVESHRAAATTMGFLVSAIGIAVSSQVPIYYEALREWRLLDDDGFYSAIADEDPESVAWEVAR